MIPGWSPLVFVGSLTAVVGIAWIVRRLGEDKLQKSEAFLAANPVPSENQIENPYWGFYLALKRIYIGLERLHSGLLNDYLYWLILLIVILSLVVLG